MADGARRVPGARLPSGIDTRAPAVVVRQDSVVTTAQLQMWGVQRSLAARRVAAGEWQRLCRGVVVLHSGPVLWRQRARGALLYAGRGAALSHRSAAFVHGLVPAPGPDVVLSIPADRAVRSPAGVVVHRRGRMPFASGRLRTVGVDDTLLDLLDETSEDDDVVGLVCDAVRQGVLPGRVLVHAAQRPRLRHRALLLEFLGEPGHGVESPLERRYDRDVERRHGLPRARAQVSERVEDRWIRADRVYDGVRVEDSTVSWRTRSGGTDDDTWRDNAVLIARGDVTLRYRWRHVVAAPCATPGQVAAALRSHGWRGHPTRCSAACTAGP